MQTYANKTKLNKNKTKSNKKEIKSKKYNCLTVCLYACVKVGQSVKIYFLIALVPVYSIKAYLAGMLISQVIMTFMEGFYLKKYITIDNEDKITDFISYFIKILRKEFEKGENNNAKSM